MKALILPLLLIAVAGSARGNSAAETGDARVKTFATASTGLLRLPTSPGTIQTILFARGERVQSIVLTNPDAYKVAVTGSGDALSLHALDYLPPVIMSVLTERASYQFELAPSREGAVPTVVRFVDGTASSVAAPAAVPVFPPPPQLEGFTYRLGGKPALRPAAISDDGSRIYISWSDEQAMPAVFTLGPGGKEETIDGYMRGKTYVIDRVLTDLVFRIDRDSAKASRIKAGTKRRGRDD